MLVHVGASHKGKSLPDGIVESISSKKMDTPTPKLTSDLCKPLSAILTDSSSVSMLDYFIQFMDSESALHIVQFWLTVEAFKSAPSNSTSVLLPTSEGVVPLRPSEGVCAISSGHSSQSCELQLQVKGQKIDKNRIQDCPTTLSSRDKVMCVRPTFCDESSQVSHDISCDPRHPSVPSSADVSHDPRHSSSNHTSSLRSEDGASSVSASQEISLSYCSRLVTDTGSKCNNYLYSDNRNGCSSEESTRIIGCESESHDQRQNVPSSVALSKQNSLCKFNSSIVVSQVRHTGRGDLFRVALAKVLQLCVELLNYITHEAKLFATPHPRPCTPVLAKCVSEGFE